MMKSTEIRRSYAEMLGRVKQTDLSVLLLHALRRSSTAFITAEKSSESALKFCWMENIWVKTKCSALMACSKPQPSAAGYSVDLPGATTIRS